LGFVGDGDDIFEASGYVFEANGKIVAYVLESGFESIG
jgi:hypothetical protein